MCGRAVRSCPQLCAQMCSVTGADAGSGARSMCRCTAAQARARLRRPAAPSTCCPWARAAAPPAPPAAPATPAAAAAAMAARATCAPSTTSWPGTGAPAWTTARWSGRTCRSPAARPAGARAAARLRTHAACVPSIAICGCGWYTQHAGGQRHAQLQPDCAQMWRRVQVLELAHRGCHVTGGGAGE